MNVGSRALAEFFGTFWLVLGGCGSAVFAAGIPTFGILYLGVSLAFGLTVLTMAYAVGHISGGHFNPAVSVGLLVGGRFDGKDLVPYVIAQVLGAIAAAFVIYVIWSGNMDAEAIKKGTTLASNGMGALSPNGFSMTAGIIAEIVLTAFFIFVILGSTDGRAPAGFAPIAIGLCLTLIHLISIPITNTSVNPARSTGPALVTMLTGNGSAHLMQVWVFWVAPIIGAVIGAICYRATGGRDA